MNREATLEGWDSRLKRREQQARSVSMDVGSGEEPAEAMRKPDFEALFQRLRARSITEERPCEVCQHPTTDANNPPLCL